jgi:hypothetical protein
MRSTRFVLLFFVRTWTHTIEKARSAGDPKVELDAQRSSDKYEGGTRMKKILAALAIAITLAPLGASAEERTGDAALGALAGAVVLGPIGLVAGAAVGYTAGPSIASSWGLRRSHTRHSAKPAAKVSSNQ